MALGCRLALSFSAPKPTGRTNAVVSRDSVGSPHRNQTGRVICRLWANDDFHFLVEQGNEVRQALCREKTEFDVARFGVVGLADAEVFGDKALRQLPVFDEGVEARGELDAKFPSSWVC